MAAADKAPRKASGKAKTLASIKSLDPEDDERTTISKKISWILRHGLSKGYVEASDGWVKMADLLKAEILDGVARETIDKVVIDSNAKKLRYQLSSDGSMIKAYSKGERKALTDNAPEPKEGASLSAEAAEFVPGSGASMIPGGGGLSQMGYPWPYGLGMNPLMQYPFGWPGMGVPPAARAPPVPMGPAALAAGRCRGKIKSFNPDKGFGFIDCPQVYSQYNRDVFVHKAQIGELKVGADVIFSVETNKQGMPQAKDVTSAAGIPAVPGGAPGGKGKKGGKDGGKGKAAKGEGKAGKGEGKAGKGEGKGKKGEGKKKAKDAGEAGAEKAEEAAEAKVEDTPAEKVEEAPEKAEEAA